MAMRENRIKTIWKQGQAAVNGWLAIPNVFSAETMAHAGWDSLTFAMIETRQALENLDDILSVDGLDAVYIGPSDLSLALGCTPKLDQDEKPVVEAIDHILARAKKHGIVAGIHNATPDYARRMIAK